LGWHIPRKVWVVEKVLNSPPILWKPNTTQLLLVYIAASIDAFNVDLVQEICNNQQSVYFISKTLQDVETIYQIIQKVALSLLTWEAKVVCFLKILSRLNEALLNYLEAINIGMKSTLMKERRFDDIHGDQGWNVCSPCSYII